MPTSATGISISSRARGFTLIEILVVVVIIGVMATGALLSLSSVGDDRGLKNENDRLYALMNYAREQAELQTREFGIRVFDGGYEFLAFDPFKNEWARIADDDALRSRTLPPDMSIAVRIEGRRIVLPKRPDGKSKQLEDLKPQVLLMSSGELNAFEVFLLRPATGKGRRVAAAESDDRIEDSEMQADAL
jgi:general secretion pathway protein H